MHARALGCLAAGLLASAAFLPGVGRAADVPPLNDPAVSQTLPGKFVWADFFTSDADAAAKFYTGLFGWTTNEIARAKGRTYTVLSNGDHPIAGIVERTVKGSTDRRGRWVGFISVPDVAQCAESVKTNGGTIVMKPKDFPQRGTLALFRDPEGAVVGAIHSSTGDPGDYQPDVGDWIWMAVFARDTAAAGRFYTSTFGYKVMSDESTERTNDYVFVSGDFSRGGLQQLPDKPNVHPDWLAFVRVADLDATLKRATDLGGRVVVQPKQVREGSKLAVVIDPTGGAVGLIQLTDDDGDMKKEGQP